METRFSYGIFHFPHLFDHKTAQVNRLGHKISAHADLNRVLQNSRQL